MQNSLLSPAVLCGRLARRTDRHAEANSRFSQFCEKRLNIKINADLRLKIQKTILLKRDLKFTIYNYCLYSSHSENEGVIWYCKEAPQIYSIFLRNWQIFNFSTIRLLQSAGQSFHVTTFVPFSIINCNRGCSQRFWSISYTWLIILQSPRKKKERLQILDVIGVVFSASAYICVNAALNTRQQNTVWNHPSSGWGVRRFEIDVSGLPIGPIFKCQAVQEKGRLVSWRRER